MDSEERERQRLQRVKRNKEDVMPLLKRLEGIGVCAQSIDQLTREHAPLSRQIVTVLLEFLEQNRGKNSDIDEAIVRSLGASRTRYDARTLAALFESVDSWTLKWAIGNTLSLSRPRNIAEWMVNALLERKHGRGREMLCVAVAKSAEPDSARQALRSVYEEMPGHAAMGLAIVGDEEDLDFLQKEAEKAHKTWVRKEIQKAIVKIERRIERISKPQGQ